jgi:hypothetical protein
MRQQCSPVIFLLLSVSAFAAGPSLPPGITFRTGSPNTVIVGAGTAVYSIPAGARRDRILLTHARRDILPVAGTDRVGYVVPAAERELFENPAAFWAALETGRFHDYAQQSTKVPVHPLPVLRAVSDGDTLDEGGVRIRVIGTPGFTRGAVSYLIETGGMRIACTGDLIYGDGRIFDLYSLQDAVPEAKGSRISRLCRTRWGSDPKFTKNRGGQAGHHSSRARSGNRPSASVDRPADRASPDISRQPLRDRRLALVLGR